MMQLKIIFYDCLHYPLLFGIGGAVNIVDEEDEVVTKRITTVFVKLLLASLGSTNKHL